MSRAAGKGLQRPDAAQAGRAEKKKRNTRPEGARADVMALQQTAGNRAVGALLGRSSGRPLDPATRDEMESKFGENFEDVRVHTGHSAEVSAVASGARALTKGNDIIFGPGYYSPGTSAGRRLLAHELAHVVQQTRRSGAATPADASETEAREAASSVAAGESAPVTASAPAGAQCDPMTDAERRRKQAELMLPTELVTSLRKSGIIPPDQQPAGPPAAPSSPTPGRGAAGLGIGLAAGLPLLGALIPNPSTPAGPGAPGGGLDPSTVWAGREPGLPGLRNAATGAGEAAKDVAADTATDIAADTAASETPALVGDIAMTASRAGVAGLGFAIGLLGPFAVGYSIEHSEELQRQPDPDVVSPPGGAAPQPQADLDAGAGNIQAQAPPAAGATTDQRGGTGEIQAPAPNPPLPAVDPTQQPAQLPAKENQAPAVDPNRTQPAQLPGLSQEEIEATSTGARPSLRRSTILQVWQNALKQGKGKVRDPNSGEILEAPYYDKQGKLIYDWQMGHREDREWWRLRRMHEMGILTWERVIEEYNNPVHYQPESAEENVSHEHESRTEWVLPDGRKVRYRRPTRGKPIRRKR
jgi:hypothetical protein